ncbi:MAG: hypothetical protein AAGF44_02245 [Pseudomonadota bacterium]
MLKFGSSHIPARIALVLATLALAACAGPTPYAPAVDRNGFADQALEEDRFQVRFSGNSRTARETVESYLLYRAAEVTLASGHDWFRVADQETEVETRFRGGTFGSAPFIFRSSFRFSRFGFGATTGRPINRYEAFANIVVFEGEKPADDPLAYDARSVIETLEPTILRPEVENAL